MGDTDTPNIENQNESFQSTTCDIPKPSIDTLKAAKPSENIAISGSDDKSDSPLTADIKEMPPEDSATSDSTDNGTLKIAYEVTAKKLEDEPPKCVVELKNDKVATENLQKDNDDSPKVKDKTSLKNRSDIFSLNENKIQQCTIFSVGGAPAKTIHKTLSLNSDKTSSSNETIGSATSKQSQLRNPVTGIGVNSNDEFKSKPTKRKDGNPLLGVGYKDDDAVFNTPTARRIPPGGYSKGLW